MRITDLNGYPISKAKNNPRHRIIEKCIFCGIKYTSPIDKYYDICPNCEDSSLE